MPKIAAIGNILQRGPWRRDARKIAFIITLSHRGARKIAFINYAAMRHNKNKPKFTPKRTK